MTDAELDDYFRVIRIEAKTPRTETDPAAIRAIIARVQREGCVNTEDSHFLGVAGVATAIRGPSGRHPAAPAVIGTTPRFNPASASHEESVKADDERSTAPLTGGTHAAPTKHQPPTRGRG